MAHHSMILTRQSTSKSSRDGYALDYHPPNSLSLGREAKVLGRASGRRSSVAAV